MKVVVFMDWTEQFGSEHYRASGPGAGDGCRDWVDTAIPSIIDMGINDPLNEYHNRSVS